MKHARPNHLHTIRQYSLLLTVCAALLIGGALLAAGEVLTRSAITIAGGQATVNGIELRSAVGQPVAGITSSGAGEMCIGLICPGSGSTQGLPQLTPTPIPSVSSTPNPTQTPATSTPVPTPGPGSEENSLFLPLVNN